MPLLKAMIRFFDSFSLIATVFLLVVVAFNIIARQLYDLTGGSLNLMIPGAIELSRYSLLLLVFAALPRAASGKMVRVELLAKRLPGAVQKMLNSLWLVLMAVFCAMLFWLFSQQAWLTFHRGDATQDLQLPLFYFYALISLACLASTLACLGKAFFPEQWQQVKLS